jgi:hypothetical protein
VKDAAGCIKDSTITITQPAAIVPAVSALNIPCFGQANGALTLSATNGTAPYTFAIGAGPYTTSGSFTGLSAGTYVLHTKDANNCIKDTTVTLTQQTPIYYTLALSNVLCNAGTNGSVTVTGSGGMAPYTYAVNAGAFGASNVLGGLSAGTHTIRMKDDAGCIKDTLITITQPPVIVPSVAVTNVACNGAATGSLTLSAAGGTPIPTP